FRFKQFQLIQSENHLKITTEATLFAAWADAEKAQNILDIGAGTGVLSLMLAQKSNAQIEAIEIQKGAMEICADNFKNSPWKKRLKIHHSSIQNFDSAEKYEAIVCNPPFFFKQSKRKQESKNRAMHNESLSLGDLLAAILRLLKKTGKFYVLLPPETMQHFVLLASENGLYLHEKLQLIHKPGKPVLREAACFAFQKPKSLDVQQLIIRNADESYSNAYRELLREYLIIF
ncbi:MAG: methyltransferase, partial [Chitinophagales bacterium]